MKKCDICGESYTKKKYNSHLNSDFHKKMQDLTIIIENLKLEKNLIISSLPKDQVQYSTKTLSELENDFDTTDKIDLHHLLHAIIRKKSSTEETEMLEELKGLKFYFFSTENHYYSEIKNPDFRKKLIDSEFKKKSKRWKELMKLSKKNQPDGGYTYSLTNFYFIYAALYEFDIEGKHYEFLYVGQTTKSLKIRWGGSGYNHIANAISIIKGTGSTNKLEDLILAWKGQSVVSLFIIDCCNKEKGDLNFLEREYKECYFTFSNEDTKYINLSKDNYGLNKK
jgi:hypothetical protein